MTPGPRSIPRPSEARTVALNLTAKELVFLQKVTRQEYHFITDEEQQARLQLRDKLVEAAFDQERGRVVLTLTRDELLFLIKVARETVGDLEIMVDPGGSQQFWPHGYKWALRTAQMLDDYGVVWFEEALPPDDLEGYKLLRERARVMISAGEVLTRRQSFVPFLEGGAWDIVQPDCTKVGGISEAWHVGWMAYRHNVLTVPHGWNTAVGVAADLHLVAALPAGKWIEFHQPSDVINAVVAEPFVIDQDGMMVVPTGPGLGIKLDWDGIKRLSTES